MTKPTFSRAAMLAGACLLSLLVACNRSQNGQAAGGASGAAYADSGYVVGSGAGAAPPLAQGSAPRREYARYAPPPIPTYDQPPPPADGYVWTPGYWAWSDEDADYYWVPGVWVRPPDRGDYWTPGYWAFVDDEYVWSPGFWGPSVGFYGGVDYGWGYDGHGYRGGRWQDGRFFYNAALNNLGALAIASVYREPAPIWGRDHSSYNGGPGGVRALPTHEDVAALSARRLAPTEFQARQAQTARQAPDLRASVNRGAPPIAATQRPGEFSGPGVIAHARPGGHYTPPPPAARTGPGPGGGPVQGPPGHAVAPGFTALGHGGGPQGPAGRPGEGPRGAPVAPGPRPEQARPAPEMAGHGGSPVRGEPGPANRPAAPVREAPLAVHAPSAARAPQAPQRAFERSAPPAAFERQAPPRAFERAPAVERGAPAREAPAFHAPSAPPPRAAAPVMHAAPAPRAAPPPQVHAAPAPAAHEGGGGRPEGHPH